MSSNNPPTRPRRSSRIEELEQQGVVTDYSQLERGIAPSFYVHRRDVTLPPSQGPSPEAIRCFTEAERRRELRRRQRQQGDQRHVHNDNFPDTSMMSNVPSSSTSSSHVTGLLIPSDDEEGEEEKTHQDFENLPD